MKFALIVPGKIAPKALMPAQEEYLARLKKRIGFEYIEVKGERIGKRPKAEILEAGGERILKAIGKHDHVVALDESGKFVTTMQLSKKLETYLQSRKSRTVFVIGGALGLSPAVKSRADEIWSLSKLALAGGVARIVLLEAIYRADTIRRNEPYHNA